MRPNRRLRGAVGAGCLAAATLALLWPGRPAGPGAADRRGDPLEAQVAAAHRKLVLKCAVVSDLIAGRLTLAAAVDRFEEIEAQFPELAEQSRRQLEVTYPVRTFRERLARSAVAHCESRLYALPFPAGAVLARLNAELAAFVGPPGVSAPAQREPTLDHRQSR